MQNFEEQTVYFGQFKNRELNNAHWELKLEHTFSQNKLRFIKKIPQQVPFDKKASLPLFLTSKIIIFSGQEKYDHDKNFHVHIIKSYYFFNKRFLNWKRKNKETTLKKRFDSIATEGLEWMKQCFIDHPIISRYLNVGLKKLSCISFHKCTSKCQNITVNVGSTLRPSREYGQTS